MTLDRQEEQTHSTLQLFYYKDSFLIPENLSQSEKDFFGGGNSMNYVPDDLSIDYLIILLLLYIEINNSSVFA